MGRHPFPIAFVVVAENNPALFLGFIDPLMRFGMAVGEGKTAPTIMISAGHVPPPRPDLCGRGRQAGGADAGGRARTCRTPVVRVVQPVTNVLPFVVIGLMADGWSEADILRNYPGLSHDDIAACLAYARDVLRSGKVYPRAA